MSLRLYNTATHSIEEFSPISPPLVTMYNCGPTVYNNVHIGNLRSYVFADTIRRTLEWSGYKVKQVINITDVGHLVSDGNDGEDKMTIGATREGLSVEDIIKEYSNSFFTDIDRLNIERAYKYPRATAHIREQIELIEKLQKKGFTYITSDGIYFDTSKFSRYTDFARIDVQGLEAGSRVALGEKINSTDFALWKFSPLDGKKREQEWDSPLDIPKKGFPGWHLECSAMAMKYLGETIDIHTGGVDHIPVHHTNEIAQSECATEKTFVNFWLHNAHILVDNQKMSKSLGNGYTLNDLQERGIPPLAYRYWLLTAHYRTQVNFTWEAIAGAQSAYNRLTNFILSLDTQKQGTVDESYIGEFNNEISNDLNTANSIALIWKLTKDITISNEDKYATLLKINEVLGLGLESLHSKKATQESPTPPQVTSLLELRETARSEKKFTDSDRLRDEIKSLGYEVKDTPDGQKIYKI